MEERINATPVPAAARVRHQAFNYYDRLKRVREYLEKHIDQELTLGQAARIAGLNETYFSAYFHRKVGVRFCEWVNLVRVRCATALISGTDAPITEIAQRVGYRDLRTFERSFRRHMCTTAREYRKRVRPS